MKREFLINIILLVIINLIVKVAYLFLIEVEVQNTVGPEAYGIFLALFNFAYLFQFINDPGLQSFNTTVIASGSGEVIAHFRKIMGLKLLLSLAFILAVMLAAYVVGYDDWEIRKLLLLVAVNQVLSTSYMFFRSNLSALGHYRHDTFISALDKLLMIIILGYLLNYHRSELTITHFVLAQMAAFFLSIMVVIVMLWSKKLQLIPQFSIGGSMEILRGAAPFALVLLLMASYNKMDGVMLERLLDDGAYHAGIYAASLRFMEAANMGAYLMAALLLPMFAAHHNDLESISQLSGIAIRLMLVYITIVCVVGISYRIPLMGIYDAYDDQYNNLLIFHLLSFGCIAISYVYGTLLTATRRLRKMNYVLMIGLIVNLVLNLWLIPQLFAEGAAMATLTTQAIVMAGQVFLAITIFKLGIHSGEIIKGMVYILISFAVAFGISLYTNIYWVWGATISVILIGILSFLMGIVRKDMIFALLKEG